MITIGDGLQCYLYQDNGNGFPVSDTTAHVAPLYTIVKRSRIVSFQLVTTGTLDGSWLIEGSNDYCGGGGSEAGQAPNTGHWTNITALFTQPGGSALATVAHGTAATQNQFVQAAPVGCRAVRITFTATAGTGNIIAMIAGGAY